MKPKVLIRNLMKHHFEFNLGWYDEIKPGHWVYGGGAFYCINIILSNFEYTIPLNDYYGLAELWKEIKTHYIY